MDMEYLKKQIVVYMTRYHVGHKNGTARANIVSALGIDDRTFRDLCSEIPEIITSSKWGYYILPLVDRTGEEVRVARDIIEGEDRRRLIALYLRQRRQRKALRILADKPLADLFAK